MLCDGFNYLTFLEALQAYNVTESLHHKYLFGREVK